MIVSSGNVARLLCRHCTRALLLLSLAWMPLLSNASDRFAPLNLPLADTRTEQGTPSAAYWQQQLAYEIQAKVDAQNASLSAAAVLHYVNHSPDTLTRLWFELPQQRFAANSLARKTYQLDQSETGGTRNFVVRSEQGEALALTWQDTLVAVNLVTPLKPGQGVQLHFEWDLQLVSRDHPLIPRSGYERIDGENRLLAFAQWYPRALHYGDNGWNLQPFIKHAEFSLQNADFTVSIEAPPEYLLVASGDWQSPANNLPPEVYERYQQVSHSESKKILSGDDWPIANQQPWQYRGEHLRDFTFVLAKNVHWQARKVRHKQGDILVSALFPDTGRWLWHQYGLEAGVFAISELTWWLGAPAARSIHLVNIAGLGMEYPGLKLVGFRGPDAAINGPPPDYSRTQKYDVIGGILHEIAHAWMPMTVNTDERGEGFFDEGLTSFLAFWLEQRWSHHFQSFYGEPVKVAPVMSDPDYAVPVTFAEELSSKLDSHYHVPAVALNILRETLLGRDQFDAILTDFFGAWRGKLATFGDFIRFVDERSEQDLAWFWRGWFMQPGYVDMAIAEARILLPQSWNRAQKLAYAQRYPERPSLTRQRNQHPTHEQRHAELRDGHSALSDEMAARLEGPVTDASQPHLQLTLNNLGGLPMPVPIRLTYTDGSEVFRLFDVTIWQHHPDQALISLPLSPDKVLQSVHMDPFYQIGDAGGPGHVITQPEF